MKPQHWTKTLSLLFIVSAVTALPPYAANAQEKSPHIVIIWGDDIGQSNISAYTRHDGLSYSEYRQHRP